MFTPYPTSACRANRAAPFISRSPFGTPPRTRAHHHAHHGHKVDAQGDPFFRLRPQFRVPSPSAPRTPPMNPFTSPCRPRDPPPSSPCAPSSPIFSSPAPHPPNSLKTPLRADDNIAPFDEKYWAARHALEDSIFEEQFARLQVEKIEHEQLLQCRETVEQAVKMQPTRSEEHKKRDRRAAALFDSLQQQRRYETRKWRKARRDRKRQELEDQARMHAQRRQQARLEADRKKVERELKRKMDEARQHELDEFLRKRKAMMEEMRQNIPPPPPQWTYQPAPQRSPDHSPRHCAFGPTIGDRLARYERLWNALRPMNEGTLNFSTIPWPVLIQVQSLADLTKEGIAEFVFHPLREGQEGKPRRTVIRDELLRWHPDKFTARVLDKVVEPERTLTWEGAEVVVRLLTEMMAEE